MRSSGSIYLLICLSLETLSSIIRISQPILMELKDLVSFIIICLSQVILLKWLCVLPGPPDSRCLAILDLFISSDAKQWLSLHWEILIMLPRFPFTFYKLKGDAQFNRIAYVCSCADWDSLHD